MSKAHLIMAFLYFSAGVLASEMSLIIDCRHTDKPSFWFADESYDGYIACKERTTP